MNKITFPHTLRTLEGDTAVVMNPQPGVYDLKVTYANGDTDDLQWTDEQHSDSRKTSRDYLEGRQSDILHELFRLLR
jgi:hypothetical protein